MESIEPSVFINKTETLKHLNTNIETINEKHKSSLCELHKNIYSNK